MLFVQLKDPQRSSFYIDPRTARIVGSYSSGRWPERWLYHGLHSINLPWLYNHRPAWDIAVLFLMLGGTLLSVTSIVIGWRFLFAALTSAGSGYHRWPHSSHRCGRTAALMNSSSLLRR